MVRAENVTTTLLYTYTADGLRVAQAVDGAVTTFAWDWASGIPEMLVQTPNPPSPNPQSLYQVGHDTLGYWDGNEWAYHLPDALGSVRQTTDGAGSVTGSREWKPFGVELGAAQAGLGYTGEYWDSYINRGMLYLRARWYEPQTARFTSLDPITADFQNPQSINGYTYGLGNPARFTDPSGQSPFQYDGQAAAGYALDHWKGPPYNYTEYVDLDVEDFGGDCTNFASQALWAGGLRDPRPRETTPSSEAAVGFWDTIYWNSEVVKVSNWNPDSDRTWVSTPHLHKFLTEVLHFPEIRYDNPPHVKGQGDEDALDMEWITFLAQRGSSIRPGDIVFYDQDESDAAWAPWTRTAIVVGWGLQTYFPDGDPIPVSSAAPPPVSWSCIGTQKPLVVEHSGADFSRSPQNKQPRSIDNTNSDVERISIVLVGMVPLSVRRNGNW
jgi:RHS repeat-associated protein